MTNTLPTTVDDKGAGAVVGTTVGGRRLTPKGVATRARILEQATEAFANDGYAAVSIRTIASRTGLTTGAIYATFGGKANLLLEAVRTTIETGLEAIPDVVTREPLPDIVAWQFEKSSDPSRKRLRKLLIGAAVAATTDSEVRDALGRLLEERLEKWSDAHRDWQRDNRADPHADMWALTTLSMAIDLGMGLLDELGVRTPNPQHTAELVRSLLISLLPREE